MALLVGEVSGVDEMERRGETLVEGEEEPDREALEHWDGERVRGGDAEALGEVD